MFDFLQSKFPALRHRIPAGLEPFQATLAGGHSTHPLVFRDEWVYGIAAPIFLTADDVPDGFFACGIRGTSSESLVLMWRVGARRFWFVDLYFNLAGGYYDRVNAQLEDALGRWDAGSATFVAYNGGAGWYDAQLGTPPRPLRESYISCRTLSPSGSWIYRPTLAEVAFASRVPVEEQGRSEACLQFAFGWNIQSAGYLASRLAPDAMQVSLNTGCSELGRTAIARDLASHFASTELRDMGSWAELARALSDGRPIVRVHQRTLHRGRVGMGDPVSLHDLDPGPEGEIQAIRILSDDPFDCQPSGLFPGMTEDEVTAVRAAERPSLARDAPADWDVYAERGDAPGEQAIAILQGLIPAFPGATLEVIHQGTNPGSKELSPTVYVHSEGTLNLICQGRHSPERVRDQIERLYGPNPA